MYEEASTVPPMNPAVVNLDAHRHQRILNRAHFEEANAELASYLSLEEGWDGPGSLPPTRSAVSNALTFLQQLPSSTTAPEATVSADGWVGVYWQAALDVISVAFSGEGLIAYFAKLDGVVVTRGTVEFTGTVPQDLLGAITRI